MSRDSTSLPWISLLASPQHREAAVVSQCLPAREARFVPWPASLDATVRGALEARGLTQLYTHQAEVWEALDGGHDVVLATPTASGKSLAYQLPLLQMLHREPEGRALLLFPTKALAHDQRHQLKSLTESLQAQQSKDQGEGATVIETAQDWIGTYDGDTSGQKRKYTRANARLLLSNPDMLHIGILPYHGRWAHFFRNLRYVVLDEVHIYRGVFGAHVANVLRRLRRICAFYGASPQFCMMSATIANPASLGRRLVESEVRCVTQDGSPQGERHLVIYNPPMQHLELGMRHSAASASLSLANGLLEHGLQTIVFGRSRRGIEMMLTALRQTSSLPETQIRGYRSGYLAKQRRAIEEGLRAGEVLAVVATQALELGVDIGGVDAVVMSGYPGSIAATLQQAGRAGRRQRPALALLVVGSSPLEQFLVQHPEMIMGRSPEQALLDPDNPLILIQHLRCALFELPFQHGDSFGGIGAEDVSALLDFLVEEQEAHQRMTQTFWASAQYPAQEVALRQAGAGRVQIVVKQGQRYRTLGQVDEVSACRLVHPQAVYLHEGERFVVDSLDLEAQRATLRAIEVDYYTEPYTETEVELLEVLEEEACGEGSQSYGEIEVITQVTQFSRFHWDTRELLGRAPLDLPPRRLETVGFWISLSSSQVETLRASQMWRNDPNDYGPMWPTIRRQVRERDHFKCRVCGVPESRKRGHDVHHKVPFRLFPDPAIANHLDNLITLCVRCHRRAEQQVMVRSGLAGVGYVFRHLAPLWLMCAPQDLGMHIDDRSPLNQKGPVIMIYEQIPGGIGLSEQLFAQCDAWFSRAITLIEACPCAEGCPACVGPGGPEGSGSKRESLAILQLLKKT